MGWRRVIVDWSKVGLGCDRGSSGRPSYLSRTDYPRLFSPASFSQRAGWSRAAVGGGAVWLSGGRGTSRG